MGRPPIGKAAMTDAERQRRRRAARKAEQPAKPAVPDEVEQLKAKITRLEQELQQARDDFAQFAAVARRTATIDPTFVRRMKGLLHPDRVSSPEAKEHLHKVFIEFTAAIEPVESAAKLREDLMRRRQAVREANSRRSKEAWARRKAAQSP